MLVRLMYASRANGLVTPEMLSAIMRKSHANNPAQGITGALCASGDVFLQMLEGGRLAVSSLYARIAQDPRHRDVMLLSYEEIAERRFAGWAMGQVNVARLNPALLLKYSAQATLDPYSVSAKVSMALFDELVVTAAIVGG